MGRTHFQRPAQRRRREADYTVEDHDGCQRSPVKRGSFHQGANDLEMLGGPIRFHDATLLYKATSGKHHLGDRATGAAALTTSPAPSSSCRSGYDNEAAGVERRIRAPTG